jgi:hypothetical protein
MSVSDYEGRVDSIAAVEYIDNDNIPYMVFGIPNPTKEPVGIPERDYVFYYDLTRPGAFAAAAVIATAFNSGLTLQMGLVKGPNAPKGRADWVQLIRRKP